MGDKAYTENYLSN